MPPTAKHAVRTTCRYVFYASVLLACAMTWGCKKNVDGKSGGQRIEKSLSPDDATINVESGSPGSSSGLSELIDFLPKTSKASARASKIADGVLATEDTWPTEAFSEIATKHLKKLASSIETGTKPSVEHDALAASDFSCRWLRPDQLTTVFAQSGIEVRRWTKQESNEQAAASSAATQTSSTVSKSISPTPSTSGTGLYESLQTLFAGLNEPRAAFKIVRVRATDDGFETKVLAEGGGKMLAEGGGKMLGAGVGGSFRSRQWSATWEATWTKDAELRSISVLDFEEVSSTQSAWLADATGWILGKSVGYREQLLYGMDHWVNRLEHRLHVNRLGHHGLAIGDVNGDGLEDIYVCQPGGLPNRLFIHQPNGTAIEQGQPANVDIYDDTTAALFVDFDNDGDQDLAMLTVSGGFIFSNDGQGRFQLRATMPECRNAFSLTAADYDRDGLLDLYVGRYWPEESVRGAIPLPVPYYDALNGGSNVLLQNGGDWKFSDVTTRSNLHVDNTRYTMAAAWEDYDNDGDQDLYVANDFGRNCLYRNDDGRFVNVAQAAGVEDTAAGMSVSWADYNHDGNMDVYIGNMFSSAGGRIAYQRQYERFDAVARGKLQRLARGNSLFSNLGVPSAAENQRFADVSQSAAVTMGRWAWGSVFTDLNNDSWDDIVVANGHVTTEDTGDL